MSDQDKDLAHVLVDRALLDRVAELTRENERLRGWEQAYAEDVTQVAREARQKEKGRLARARRVLDDFFDSPEPRDMRHAMQALRAIICEGG